MGDSEKYYFFPPLNPQFYFPKTRFKQFVRFYKPYTIKAKLVWFVFINVPLFKELFTINELKLPMRLKEVKNRLDIKDASIFFNLGTPGLEQKITAIAKNNQESRFIKFGSTEVSKQLIKNEANTLKFIDSNNCFSNTPKLLMFKKEDEHSYLMTNVAEGRKVLSTQLTISIIRLLKLFPKELKQNNGLSRAFSHGDFCPWNMLIDSEDNIILVDWEMAAFRSLGYDLFTFIFQTNFLLNPQKDISNLIKENENWIQIYFNSYQIKDYSKYLYSFALEKLKQESNKPSTQLFLKYQKLQSLCE